MPKPTVRISGTMLLAAGVGAVLGALRVTKPDAIPMRGLAQPLWISLALYAAFTIYWTIAARNSAPVKQAEPRWSTALHQSLLQIAMLLLFLRVPGLAGRWLPLTLAPLFTPAGIALEAAAILLAVWARRHLGSNWSAAITAKVDHQLIRTGPYRLIRHPIYTAVFGIYIGIALASGEWHAVAGVALLTIAYWRKIRLEEQNLQREFGASYESYCRNSWALVPWLD